jgi:dolichol-phosphate mannosyltransferase
MKQLLLSVVIPAFNEEQNIAHTVQELEAALSVEKIPYELIIVNDNSRDRTAEVVASLMAASPAIRTVNRQAPEGFGRAIRAGLEVVKGEVVVICMADCSDDPRDVVAYYMKIEEGYDCVFGSRFIKGGRVEHYPLAKLIVNRIVNKSIQWLFWCPFNDLTNAFKAYRTHVIRTCGPYRACHFNVTIEMSLSALIHQYRIAQVPISWRGRTWGSSNLRLREMGRRYLSVLLKALAEKVLVSDDVVSERLSESKPNGSGSAGNRESAV